jgi:acetyl-CoA carboxylase biotin carboxylase subunit
VLVANRGEIAVRIVRAARTLGMESVLATSEADKNSMAAREADRTTLLGPSQPRLSYLDVSRVLHAAQTTGCNGLHPGYGFLSERAELAKLCVENRITFVGPTADSIACVGDKLAARQLAAAGDVPLVEGSGRLDSAASALEHAERIGYPVLTKASAGGGGRGMVVARDPQALKTAFERATLEAQNAFGDGTLFVERYVDCARHIEVQLMGDGAGEVRHFGERDCSIQRRYQKMIEEAPAEVLPSEVRSALHSAAIRLLSAIRYRNAGTVEFLYDVDTRKFYFIEVNARIQVEHPVSEMICRVDLIQMQLRIAAGEPLPLQVAPRGHAIEARIIAEDPDRGFAPSPGRITGWTIPRVSGARLDTAMFAGETVHPFYDSMIAKLIVTGRDRAEAVSRLRAALREFSVDGVATNLPLLRFIADHPDYVANRLTTRWLEQTLIPAYHRR